MSDLTMNIPVPDPSALTSELIRSNVVQLRHEFDVAISANTRLREAQFDALRVRLNAMDRATEILTESNNRVPTILDRETLRLERLFAERFESVALQFKERDVRATAMETAAKEAQAALSTAATTAVNAALQAQKESAFATQQSNAEAIRKSELGFTNEITSLKFLINATKETLTGALGDLRSRIDTGGGTTVGLRQASDDNHQTLGSILGILGGFVSVVSVVAMLAFSIASSRNSQSNPPATIVSPAVVPVAPR